jgi:hypothetical protein
MVELTGLSDQQLADRYAKADLRVRLMTEHSRLMDELDELMWQIREEQSRRKAARYAEYNTD